MEFNIESGNHRKRLFVTLNEITVNLYFHFELIDYGLWPDVWAGMTSRVGRYDRSCRQIRPVTQADTTGHAGKLGRPYCSISPCLFCCTLWSLRLPSIETAHSLYRVFSHLFASLIFSLCVKCSVNER